jgi:NAD(P)-dependent dehydrogenase (short-subunit alcohol dehydrogenase family)
VRARLAAAPQAAAIDYGLRDRLALVTGAASGIGLATGASLGHGGAIVNVSSTLGLRGAANASAYSASKHAVLGITRTSAVEYAPQRIRVNAVARARSTRR